SFLFSSLTTEPLSGLETISEGPSDSTWRLQRGLGQDMLGCVLKLILRSLFLASTLLKTKFSWSSMNPWTISVFHVVCTVIKWMAD
ncbi:hypothetical protein LINPERHAP2_LOCUS4688, partial [Linum perenne]